MSLKLSEHMAPLRGVGQGVSGSQLGFRILEVRVGYVLHRRLQ